MNNWLIRLGVVRATVLSIGRLCLCWLAIEAMDKVQAGELDFIDYGWVRVSPNAGIEVRDD